MARMDGRVPTAWEARQDEETLPDFAADLGPARAPLQELRDFPFFLPDDGDDRVEQVPPSVVQSAPPRKRAAWHEGVLDGPALVLVLAYFGCGGAALIATGVLLGGAAGLALAAVGALLALSTGAATRDALVAAPGRAG